MAVADQEQLQFQNAFQQLLITLATRFINYPADQMDEAVTIALRQIVEFLGSARASINQISPDDAIFNRLYEWSAPSNAVGFPPVAPVPDAANLLPRLRNGEVLTFNRIDELPESSELRKLLSAFGIAALIVVPIQRGDELVAFIATSWNQPTDVRAEIADLLRVVGGIFLNALDRRDNEMRIRRLNEELEQRVQQRTRELIAANEQLKTEIDERHQAETALRMNEERYRLITELISDYAFLYRADQSEATTPEWITEDSFTRLTGYTPAEVGGPFRLYHPDDAERARQDVERTLQGEQTEAEYQITTRNGEHRWVLLRRYPIWDAAHEHVERFYGVAQDITERKRAEEALRISEERYRRVSELISDYAFLYRVERDGTLNLEWVTTESFNRLTGYTGQDTAEPYRRYHPEDEMLVRQDVQYMLQGHPIEREYRVLTKAGELRWIDMRRFPVWDEAEQRVVRFYGVAQDITRRKQAEAALQVSEERYRMVSELISDYAFLYEVNSDDSLKFEWGTTDSFSRLTGYTFDEINGDALLYHPDDQRLVDEDVASARDGHMTQREYRIVTKAGEPRWIDMRRFPVWGESEQRVIRYYGVAQDITARKQIEAALQVSEERYRMVSELISDYAFLYAINPDGSLKLEWVTGDSFIRLTGYTVDEVGQTFRLYHPDDEQAADEDITNARHGQATEREYRILTKDGKLRWIYLRRYPIWDASHERVTGFYGVAQDITARKQIEAEEREQRVLAEALLDTADALNSTLDLEEVLDRILANIERVVPDYEGAILLIEGGIAKVVRAKGRNRAAMETLRFPLADTPNMLQVYTTGQPLIIDDVKTDLTWVYLEPTGWIRCYVCIPIQQNEQVIGFMTWTSPTPASFSPSMLKGLQAFAHQTAVAITNATLYRQAQELAILEERQRLARDLHDAVTQTIFSATIVAEALPRFWDSDPEQVRRGITQLHELTRGALAEMRSLLIELRPEALEGASLPELLAELAKAFGGRMGIAPTLTITGERDLPSNVKVALYRIAQEALNNVGKHARASEVSLTLSLDSIVKLTVSDNGRGFTPDEVKPGSFGLNIMRERAETVGARLMIDSQPGRLTTLTVEWIP